MTGDGAQGAGLCSPPEAGAPPVDPARHSYLFGLNMFCEMGSSRGSLCLYPGLSRRAQVWPCPRGLQPAFFCLQFLPLFLQGCLPGQAQPCGLPQCWALDGTDCRASVLSAGRPLLAQPLVARMGHTAASGLLGQPRLWAGGEVGRWGEEHRGQIRNAWWRMMK